MIIKRIKTFSRAISKAEEVAEINKRLSEKGPIKRGVYKLFKLTPNKDKSGKIFWQPNSSIDREINLNGKNDLKSLINTRKSLTKSLADLDKKYGYQYSK